MFEEEVEQFKKVTKEMEEGKVKTYLLKLYLQKSIKIKEKICLIRASNFFKMLFLFIF